MSDIIRFGIVGCGAISKIHAKAIESIDDSCLLGVYDPNRENADRFSKEYSCRAFETYEDMLYCKEIDAVCICTPSGLHASLALEAIKAGKNVVVEKPVAITRAQMASLKTAISQSQVKLAVISQLRFTEAVTKIKNAIEDGTLGQILMVNAEMKYYRSNEYYASSGWRGTYVMDGGGALMNQGIHGIDLMLYLAGEAVSVSAVCKTLVRDIEAEDTACIVAEYKNGAIGTVQGATSIEPGYPRVIEICGTRGSVALQEDTIIRWDIDGKTLDAKDIQKSDMASFRTPDGFDITNHKMQIEDFIEAIKEDREPLVNLDEGCRAVEFILAAYESSNTNTKIYLQR